MGSLLDHLDPPDYSWKRFRRMMSNALNLKCPTCGDRPLFIPWSQVRSLRDWFMPLDGCPRCGYPFEREPGYFLLAIFAINYGVGALIGLAIYLVLDFCFHLPIWLVLTLTHSATDLGLAETQPATGAAGADRRGIRGGGARRGG